jgi:hypothetical protein
MCPARRCECLVVHNLGWGLNKEVTTACLAGAIECRHLSKVQRHGRMRRKRGCDGVMSSVQRAVT